MASRATLVCRRGVYPHESNNHYLWRAVDQNGQIIDILVQARRDRAAAERFFQHLLKSTDTVPHGITDRLRSPFSRSHTHQALEWTVEERGWRGERPRRHPLSRRY